MCDNYKCLRRHSAIGAKRCTKHLAVDAATASPTVRFNMLATKLVDAIIRITS